MSALSSAPMPGCRHPSLPDFDPDQVRGHVVQYLQPGTLSAIWANHGAKSVQDVTVEPRLLQAQKVVGPAPYVGRAFIYIWRAFITTDGSNRAVCGQAHIVYRPIDPHDPSTWPDSSGPADGSEGWL